MSVSETSNSVGGETILVSGEPGLRGEREITVARTDEPVVADPPARALTLAKPPAGATETVAWIVGTPIAVTFDLGAAKIAVARDVTEFAFSDGAVLKVIGLEIGAKGLPDTAVTLADGAVIRVEDLASLAEITPSAGETLSASPAAGNTPPGNQGHATVPPDVGELGGGLDDTGALLYTDLSFSTPNVEGDTVENIIDGGAVPLALSINDVTVNEGDPFIFERGTGGDGEGGFLWIDDESTSITFAVTLNAPSTEEVTVNYAVVPGSAVPGSADQHEGDYSIADPLVGSITFAPGETVKTITLNIVDDFLPEDIENFTVILADPVGAALADELGVGTILDNDLFEEESDGAFILSSFADEGDGESNNAGEVPASFSIDGTSDLLPPVVLNE